MGSRPDVARVVQKEQGTASYSAMVPHRQGVATGRNTSVLNQDLGIPRWNRPLQRTAVVLVPEQGKYARTTSTYLEVERGMTDNVTETVAVLVRGTPVATAEGK